MLERQRALPAADELGAEELASLDGEIEALRVDPRRRPWSDGLPPALTGSLHPVQDELQRLACPAAAEFALGRTRRDGMTIRGD